MGIISIPSLGGPPTGLFGFGRLDRSSAGNAGSLFGPASAVDRAVPNFTEGLYSALGSIMGAVQNQIAQRSAAIQGSATDEKRAAALKDAAAKINAGDTAAGREIVEQQLKKNPNDVSAVRLLGHSYFNEQNYKAAERQFAKASALAPGSSTLRGELAAARALQGSDDEVLAGARRKLKSPALRADGMRELAHLIDRDSSNASAYLALADGFTAARSGVNAIGMLKEALRFGGDREIAEVLSRARFFVEKSPQSSLTRNLLGRALQKSGRLQEAITQLKLAISIAPDHLPYRKDLASAYLARVRKRIDAGDANAAASDLQIARDLDPNSSRIREAESRVAALRGEQDIRAGRYTRALSSLSRAASKAPDDVAYRKKLSSLYLRTAAHFNNKGDTALALTSYTKAFELDPTSAVARRKTAELSFSEGQEALSQGNYDTAIAHLERSYQAYRGNDTYRTGLAQAYDLRGQHRVILNQLSPAILDFHLAVGLDPTNTSYLMNLSDTLILNGGP